MNKLLFGTGGIPVCCKGDTLDGIGSVKKLGLGAFELEFVRGINISKEKTVDVKKIAGSEDVVLTCHAPYYINLNSDDRKKLGASKHRILESARIACLCGGWSVCFHAAYYMNADKNKVYDVVKKNIKEITKKLDDESVKIWIRPEITGKETQWGSVDEVLKLSSELNMVMPCIDFAHYYARNVGKFNSYEEFSSMLEKIENVLGREGLNNMHVHMSGINYGKKGELNHLNLEESKLNYKDIVRAWKDFKIKGVVISESPNLEKDAILLKNSFESA